MKLSAAVALLTVPMTGAFSPMAQQQSSTSTRLGAIMTGPKGTAADSFAEDLALTLQIIRDHDARSTTVTKDQFVQQMEESMKAPKIEVDVSIPYDAAAMLAYEASDKSVSFGDFKPKYLADAVALVKSKQQSDDISIPYDAAAMLAYEATDKSMSFADFKPKYLADAVALVISKQPVDISIPYDAAAKLAYEASDKSMSFVDFKPKYLADAVALVTSKQPAKEPAAEQSADISIPYDAAAMLAYEATDKSMSFADFKPKYLADAVALVISKQPVDISVPYDAAAKLAYEASDKSMSFGDFKPKYLADAVALVSSKKK